MSPLILASTSPRRRALLSLLEVPFDVIPPAYEEAPVSGLAPAEVARHFAAEKTRSVAERHPRRWALGCDTLIALGTTILGKPSGDEESGEMLRMLQGRDHVVHTAIALERQGDGQAVYVVESARVWMRPLSPAEVKAYLHTGEGLGKAGGYSIQGEGAGLIERLEGDYPSVVGLPLRRLARLLRTCGIEVPVDVDELYRLKPYGRWASFSA